MKNLASGAEFWDFDEKAVFIGCLIGSQVREKDGNGENQKAGTIIGYTFQDAEGDTQLIGSSHAIEKAIKAVSIGTCMRIEFLGKSEKADGQKVNRFRIDELEPGDDGYFESKSAHKNEKD